MYDIIFMNDADLSKKSFTVLKSGIQTLLGARNARGVSGDLVVHHGTNNIVHSEEWLWDWELREGMESYAYRKMKKAENKT